MSVSLLAFMLSGTLPGDARGDCVEYGDYMHPRGSVSLNAIQSVEVVGSYAYVVEEDSLEIVDVSNPDLPAVVGHIGLPTANATGVALDVSGNYAYVILFNSSQSLQIVDISNPMAPSIVGHTNAGSGGWAVAISGDYAYVADGNLEIVSVSNPSSPAFIKGMSIPRGAYSLCIAGGYLYAVGQVGLTILDLSNPADPSIVGGVDIPSLNGSITVSGAYAYVGDPYSPTGTGDDLQIVDVSDPAAPVVVNSTPGMFLQVQVANDVLYEADGFSGLRAFDLSDPASPAFQGAIGLPGGVRGVDVSGQFAYVASYSSLHVIDISNPTTPPPVGTLDLPGGITNGNGYGSIATLGSVACVLNGNSFNAIDISNPASPVQLGEIERDLFSSFPFWDVAASGHYAYLVDNYDSLKVIDILDPTTPAIVGGLELQYGLSGVAVRDTLACVSAWYTGLHVVDIKDPAVPTLLGHADIPGNPYDVAIEGNYAYVAADSAGLQIVDISVPDFPVVVGAVSFPYPAIQVVTAGAYAYVCTLSHLHVVDVSDPTTPLLVGTAILPSTPHSLAVSNNYVYIDGWFGLYIIDARDPAEPRPAGGAAGLRSPEIRSTAGIAVAGSFVYLSDGSRFGILPAQCSGVVSVQVASFHALAEERGIRLTWAASSTGDLAGFYVERESSEGHYQRLNAHRITGPYEFLDRGVRVGETYVYRLEAIDRAGKSEYFGPVAATMGEIAAVNRLGMSHPNPFQSAGAEIEFELARAGHAKLRIFDAEGRRVRVLLDAALDKGPHTVIWDGRDDRGQIVAPGIYFYRLDAGEISSTRTIVRAP